MKSLAKLILDQGFARKVVYKKALINVVGEDFSFPRLKKFIEENDKDPKLIEYFIITFEDEGVVGKSDKCLKLANDFLEYYQKEIIEILDRYPETRLDKIDELTEDDPRKSVTMLYIMAHCQAIHIETKLLLAEWIKVRYDFPYTLKELLDIMDTTEKDPGFKRCCSEIKKMVKEALKGEKNSKS